LFLIFCSIEYQNEAGSDPPDKENTDDNNKKSQKSFSLSTYATHHIVLEGITFYTEEFRIHDPTRPTVDRKERESSTMRMADSLIGSEQFYSTISSLPNQRDADSDTESDARTEQEEYLDEDEEENGDENAEYIRSGEIKIGQISSKQEIRLRMKLADHLPGPNVELEMSFGALTLFLTPRQLHLLLHLSDLLVNGTEAPTAKESPSHNPNQEMEDITSEFEFKPDFGMSGGIGLNQVRKKYILYLIED
jgi:autophagy-related protein 2